MPTRLTCVFPLFIALSGILFFTNTTATNAQSPVRHDPGSIMLALEKLNTLGSVLYVAAHPDDENTRLLSYLANERKYRTTYISLTRGDGGQNLIGKEQGAELGMIRTRELMEARLVDGAEQAFARCNDFGYSKSPEETFSFWDKEEALSDMVWAIRKFKPDVIINRFPTTGEGGHGHHTASAILALEAFNDAANPKKFPEQLKFVEPWQAKRILHNSFNFRNQPAGNFEGQIKLDVGGYDPLVGISYGEMAALSRSMHKSQGFGVARARGTQFEYFKRLDGDTAVTEIFQNINTTWSRVKGAEKIQALITRAIKEFNPKHPELTLDHLFKINTLLQSLNDPYWKSVKEKEVKDLIKACSGLWFEANSKDFYSTPGAPLDINVSAIARSTAGFELTGIRVHESDSALAFQLQENVLVSFPTAIRIPDDAPLSNPFWLDQPFRDGMYVVNNQQQVDSPWNEDFLKAVFTFIYKGQTISYTVPINYKWTDPIRGEIYRPFEILPPVSLTPSDDVMIFKGQEQKPMTVRLKCMADSSSGTIKVIPPDGWTVSPLEIRVTIQGKGKENLYTFMLTPPTPSDNIISSMPEIRFIYEEGSKKYKSNIRRIDYEHIPNLVHLRESKVKLVQMNLESKVHKIGYIEGAGDEVARCLKQAGFDVEILDENKILKTSLAGFGAIITGIRAYNTVESMQSFYTPLMKYVEEGGNLIVQYNTFNFISSLTSDIGPYPFKITRNRVTDEKAEVKILKPEHGILNHPNKITIADFDHWVQERGLYFAGDYDSHYEALISWNDPGEAPLDGGLIVTKKGKGHFIYTGISFFRQLPAGVPGAYRLMTNLINAGK